MVPSAWRAVVRGLMLAFVLPLVLPLALGGALPTLARALGAAHVHVCKCEVRGGHSTCACPICHPDREELRLTEASIRGQCGDDDVAPGGALGLFVLPAPVHLEPVASGGALPSPTLVDRPAERGRAPPTRPPRLAHARA